MSKIYVPDETFLVCSNGMKMQQLKVTSQSTVTIHGKLAATIEDRTGGNFICGKMILAGAIIGAIAAVVICAAVVASGGTLLVAVGVAAAAGAAGGAGLGAAIAAMPCTCALLTMTADWIPTHPKTLIEGKKALLENSKISCVLGGQIMIFYSKKAAEEYADLQMKRTLLNTGSVILMAYILPTTAVGIWTAGSAYVGGITSLNATVGTKAAVAFAAEGLGYIGISVGTSYGVDKVKSEAYEQLGINDYMTGEYQKKADDILDGSFGDEIDTAENATQISGKGSVADKGLSNPDGKYRQPEVTEFEEIEYEQRTIYTTQDGSIEDVEFDRTSSRATRTIAQNNPNVVTSPTNDFYSNSSEVYYNQETYRQTTGNQFHVLDNFKGNVGNSIKSGLPDLTDIITDFYKGAMNAILEGEIDDYENAKSNERTARQGMHVKTKQY